MIAVKRTFEMIDFLRKHGPSRFGEISSTFPGVSNSTLSRLLQNLLSLNVLEKKDAVYSLTPAWATKQKAEAGLSIPSEKLEHIQLILEDLALAEHMSCALFGTLGRMTMRIIAVANIENGLTLTPPGLEKPLFPMHAFAQVLLAWRDNSIRRHSYRVFSYGFFDKSKISFTEYLERLDRVKKVGYALEQGEMWGPQYRLAVPLFISPESRETGPDLVLGVGTHQKELLDTPEKTAKHLQDFARQIVEILCN